MCVWGGCWVRVVGVAWGKSVGYVDSCHIRILVKGLGFYSVNNGEPLENIEQRRDMQFVL